MHFQTDGEIGHSIKKQQGLRWVNGVQGLGQAQPLQEWGIRSRQQHTTAKPKWGIFLITPYERAGPIVCQMPLTASRQPSR
jgi:hypothetical protein